MTRIRPGAGAAAVVLLSATLLGLSGCRETVSDRAAGAPLMRHAQAPLAFEPNAGRFGRSTDFVARDRALTLALGATGTSVAVGSGDARLSTRLLGANRSSGRAERRLEGRVNWYVGPRSRWRDGVPTFGRVRYPQVYRGVDLVYHGRAGALEYDFEVAPGADPARIAMRLDGARSLRLSRAGDLVARLGSATVRQRRPVAFQVVGGERRRVPARFVLDGNRVSFDLGRYDASRKLVIDPILEFGDYIGGTLGESAYAVAAFPGGGAVVGGFTNSPSINGTSGSSPGGTAGTILKLSASGAREWITYLGTHVEGLAVHSSGTVASTGRTAAGLATTAGAFDTSFAGGSNDAFVATLNPDGTRNWVTYLGGAGSDIGQGVAVDGSGAVYVGGETNSTETNGSGVASASGVWQNANAGLYDAFVAKFNSTGGRTFGTYIGGSSNDDGMGVGVAPSCQSACDIYIAGYSQSSNFPASTGDLTNAAGEYDGFMFKLAAGGASRAWATYFGSNGVTDLIYALAVSPAGNPSMAGASASQAVVATYVGATGSTGIDGQRTFGGAASDTAESIAYDAQGNFYIAGTTLSNDLETSNAVQPDKSSSQDGFAVKWQPTSVFPVWATYLGGSGFDVASAIATDATGGTWIAGGTPSTDFPTAGATQGPTANGDQFVSRIQIRTPSIDSGPSGAHRSSSATFTYNASGEVGPTYQCRLAPNESAYGSCPSTGNTYSGLADGAYAFEVRTLDLGGTPGPVAARAFEVNTKPIAAFAMAPNPVLVGRPVTFDASGSSGAAERPLVKYEWDLDGDGTFERDSGAVATTTETFGGARSVLVGLRVTDSTGAASTTTGQLQVNDAPSIGGQLGVTINNGAQFTRDPDVTVSAVFPTSASGLLFSNDGGFLAPTTFPAQKTTKWKLDSSGPERLPKTIYVRFLFGATTSLQTYQDDIILDEIAPKMQQAVVAPAGGSASAAAGAEASASRASASRASASRASASAKRRARKRTWRVRVRATDSNSGVSRLQITSNKRRPGKSVRYKRRLKAKSVKKPRYIRARDRAGNWSKWRKAR